MSRTMQIEKMQTRGVFIPFRLKPNQARAKGELGKMLKTRHVNKKRVRGKSERMNSYENKRCWPSCRCVCLQDEGIVQNASERV